MRVGKADGSDPAALRMPTDLLATMIGAHRRAVLSTGCSCNCLSHAESPINIARLYTLTSAHKAPRLDSDQKAFLKACINIHIYIPNIFYFNLVWDSLSFDMPFEPW